MFKWGGLGALLLAVFGWGLAAGAYDLFPYPQLRAAKEALTGPADTANAEYTMTEIPFLSAERYSALETKATIAMVGDSITASGRWDELFPDASIINRGVNGDVVGGVEQRAEAILRAEPEAIFIMVGINDIDAGNTNAQILERYDAVLDALMTNGATVYVQSVLPCRDFELGACTLAKREQAQALNGDLEKLAEAKGARFIDLAAEMADENGFLERFSLDGIHMSSAGFAEWQRIIAPYIEREGEAE